MAIQQDVNININANTDEAAGQVSKLEQNIKTLDGAINLVGGSIEVLAGGLALTGAVTEEQAEKFQTAAIGAIALADGSKRALEGFKTLATETKVLTAVQKAYNAVLNANPIFIIAGVIIAATAALVAWTAANNQTKTAAERAAEALDAEKKALEELNTEQRRAKELAVARGATQEELLEQAVEDAKARKQAATDARVEQQLINQFSEETKQARADEEEAIFQVQLAEERLTTFRTNAATKAAEDREKERLANTTFSEETVNLKAKEIGSIIDIEKQGATMSVNIASQKVLQQTAIEEAAAEKRKQIAEQEEAYKQALLTSGIDNIQGALGALFGESKAVARANVLVDAAQAGVSIIKNSQFSGPFAIAYQATQFALLAATTIASLRQINQAEPGGGGTPNIPRGGNPGTPNFGASFAGAGGVGGIATVTPSAGFNVPPVRAYVVTGDVTDAQEAEAQLNSRRQFP